MTPRLALISVLAGAALIAGCGSGGSGGGAYGGSGSSSSSNTHASTSAGGGAVAVADNGSLGKILVDGQGRTLYVFGRDSAGKSNCSGACASNWPPATGAPKAGSGVTKSMLKSIKRSDGTSQLSYSGHPLYRFSGDQAAGDINGQGQDAFGGKWNALSPSGAGVTQTSSSSGGGYGGGGGY